jgi:hypothetical protein
VSGHFNDLAAVAFLPLLRFSARSMRVPEYKNFTPKIKWVNHALLGVVIF